MAQANLGFIQAQLKNDEDEIIAYDKKVTALTRAKYLRAIPFALTHKRTSVAAYIGSREIEEANVTYLDSIYNGLSKKAKATIYGKELDQLIKERKKG